MKQLQITEQQVPGLVVSGDEGVGVGLPDACVFTDDGFALLVESKIQSGVSISQLRRHIATARRYGYENPFLLLLSVDAPPKQLPSRAVYRSWREVYAWFRKRADTSQWARTLTDYIETFEAKMIAENYSIRGTLTMFDGLSFDNDHPYTYRDGKRLIRLLGDELQNRADLKRIGVDPKGGRRSAITGRAGSGVWDFLPLKIARDANSFTNYPHLTMGINEKLSVAAITIPNGIKGGFKTKLRNVGMDGFFDLLEDVERKMRPIMKRSEGARPHVYATQRHYRSQRSRAETDAHIDADLRTIVPGKRKQTKYQPQWTEAIYQVMTQKRSNIQLGVSMQFSYACPIVRSARAVDLFAEAWIAMTPVLDFAMD